MSLIAGLFSESRVRCADRSDGNTLPNGPHSGPYPLSQIDSHIMEETKQPLPNKRWHYRFSLASFLLFVAIVAGYFSGYRMGWQQYYQDHVFRMAYYVSDLIKPVDAPPEWSATDKDFGPLIDFITSTVAPNEWKTTNGSTANIRPYAPNSSLTVSCSRSTHNQLSDLLQQLRELGNKLPENYLAKVRKVADRKAPTRQIVKVFPKHFPETHRTMVNNFSSALSELSKEYGQPDLIVSAGEYGFPDWLGAQRVAVWERSIGKLYFAHVECRPEGEALIVGWWEESVGPLEPLVLASSP